jgi:hypothetical protein
MFTDEQLAQLKELIVAAVREALGQGGVVTPPVKDVVTIREDGAVQSTALLDYKLGYEKSSDPKKVEFSKYIPEWFFVEEAKTRFKLTPQQELNVHRNTNNARMLSGFLGYPLFVGTASTYKKGWFGTEPDKAIPDAASLPGSNGPNVPAVTLSDVPKLFDELYSRWLVSGHIPSWKVNELVYPK